MKILHSLALLATTAVSVTSAVADEVNIYSYRQPELLEPILDVFTNETGIETNIVFLNKGLVERLQAEGNRSPADLVFTVDISRLKAIVDADVTQPIVSDVMDQEVPAELRDPDGLWYALTTRARIVYADRARVAEGEVTTYEDLADPKWKGRICTRSGAHAYMVALTSAVMYHHGEEYAKTWLEGLKANLARKPQGNDRAQVKAIWSGECAISIGNTYYMGQMLKDKEQKEWADAVRIEFPVFEGGGTHVNVSGVAMTKSAPNKESALKLVEFLVSPFGQALYAKLNHEYPVAEGSSASALVSSWGTFTPDTAPLSELAKLRPAALKLVEEVNYDG